MMEFKNHHLMMTPAFGPSAVPSQQNLAVPSSLYPNPVMAAADPLLRKVALLTQENFSASSQEELNKEVRTFEKTLRRWRYPNEKIVSGSQILRTYIQLSLHKLTQDHEEFRTLQSHPLLVHVEKLAKKAQQYIDVLELLYLCLNLDLQAQEKEDKAWQLILKKIYQFIYVERGEMERKLSIDVVPSKSIHAIRSVAVSFLKMIGIAVVVLLGMYGASFYLLHAYSDHFSHELEAIDRQLESIH